MSAKTGISGFSASDTRRLLVTNKPFDLIDRVPEVFDVEIIVIDLNGSGYLMTVGGRAIIVTARTESWFRQNFSIAHELGHLAAGSLCEDRVRTNGADEARANKFGAELLMPEEEIRGIDWQNLSLRMLAKQIWEWGVSTKALQNRLQSLEIVPSTEIEKMLSKQSTQRLLRHHLELPPDTDQITLRMANSASRRFPTELLSKLEGSVRNRHAPVESLAYALGINVDKLDIDTLQTDAATDDSILFEGLE